MRDIESLRLSSSQKQKTLRTSQFMTLSRSLVELMMRTLMTMMMMRRRTSHQSRHEHLNLLDPTTVRLVVPALLC